MEDPLIKLISSSTSPNIGNYVEHVRELDLAALPGESSKLSSTLQSIDRSLTLLAIDSRPHLIATSNTLEDFTKKFDALASHVPDLAAAVPELASSIAEFAPVSDRHASATLYSNVGKVLDILELPTLVLTCVRNGYYAEALDLVGHVRRLGIRYQGLKVIEMVQAEVDDALLEMTTLLLRLLRENVQLPTAIKVISYLRRLQPFQTSAHATLDLQQIYLVSRSIHLKSQLQSLEPLRQLPEKYLKRYIEFFREFVFAAIVGFRSIFPSEQTSEATSDAPIADRLSDPGEQLLSSFVYATIMDLRSTVTTVLPLIADKSAQTGIHLQIIYASQSLARVGGEFWTILADTQELQNYATNVSEEPNPWILAMEKQIELAKKLQSY
ncbi:oligomeric Golgi complex subunit 8 [Lipomyces oligophaga]|uniref:oligomeric Golgi complex subunit 8 n=1 Tax=Lipomyces oligophaga TaxID=45792 RepID=UPI0034CDB3AF